MAGIGQKIKNALTPGHHKEETAAGTGVGAGYGTGQQEVGHVHGHTEAMSGQGYTTSGVSQQGYEEREAGYGKIGEEPLRMGDAVGEGYETRATGVRTGVADVPVHHHHHGHGHGEALREGAVVSSETFTRVEDRPIVKEVTETIQEHHPVEHQYVTEVKMVGEQQLPGSAEVIDKREEDVTGATGILGSTERHHGHGHNLGGEKY